MTPLCTIREFKTRNFRVIVDALPENDADLSWDESGEVAAKIDSGEYWVFTARVRVIHNKLGELAADYLGSCVYADPGEFQDHRQTERGKYGSYFADMIREAVTQARQAIGAAQSIRVRLPA